MNLKGNQTYDASAQEIWDILMDVDKLAKITPGVSKLVLTGEDQYNAISEIKIGPVKGAFQGDLFLENKNEPAGFTLRVKQKSKIGNADASVNIVLSPQDEDRTELSFDGKAKLSGTLARTGQRVLSGVAKTLTKQFFKALGEELETAKSSSPEATNVEPKIEETSTSSSTPVEEIASTYPIENNSPETKSNNTKQTVLEERKDEPMGFWAWLRSFFSGQ